MEICCNEFHAYVGMESFSNTSDYCKYCFSTLFAKFSIKAFINGVSKYILLLDMKNCFFKNQ